ncbi:MAG: transcriptional repressor [Bacteroidetes bacterium]|nr:transcriptional repressor [Bacteroidota bacterium]
MEKETAEILRKNHLSITDSRIKILELFKRKGNALAHADIEKQTHDLFDRVTIYRTLQTFAEKGIIHSIPTADNSVLYALCKDECSEGKHADNHVHFICDICETTYCLDHIMIPELQMPAGFKMKQAGLIVEGICKNCSAKK